MNKPGGRREGKPSAADVEAAPFGPESGSECLPDAMVINELQLLLAEKRTSLAFLRTGIAVFALPLSVLSVLVATSKYYTFSKVLALLIPLLVLCAALILFGTYLIVHAFARIRRQDGMIAQIKEKYSCLAPFIG